GIQSVRRAILDLGPAVLEEVGFLPAVKLYARQFSARTGISVQVIDADVPPALPATVETTLYRVLQGALANVGRHAQAKTVRITLGTVRGPVLVMTIEDDGAGF